MNMKSLSTPSFSSLKQTLIYKLLRKKKKSSPKAKMNEGSECFSKIFKLKQEVLESSKDIRYY